MPFALTKDKLSLNMNVWLGWGRDCAQNETKRISSDQFSNLNSVGFLINLNVLTTIGN